MRSMEGNVSTGEEQATVIIEKDRGSELGSFILGALVGAGLALLFAPQSGRETQEQLREQAKRLRDVTEERVKELRQDLGTRVEDARDAVDRGRQVARDARADLEEKLERSKAAARAGLSAAREAARPPEADAEAPEVEAN